MVLRKGEDTLGESDLSGRNDTNGQTLGQRKFVPVEYPGRVRGCHWFERKKKKKKVKSNRIE